MKAFLQSFSKVIKPADIIVLAVSGGVDSMVLFDLIKKTHPNKNIIVAHFDHSLRGVHSDGDREFIAKYCDKRNLRYEEAKMDIAKLANDERMSIESVARQYRYVFLSRIAEQYHARYILTAHHADDRIETAMFNLIRGSKLGGVHALSEMTDYSREVRIFRPLLSATKREILEYATEQNIAYREDASNMDSDYQRNHLRLNILPEFEQINPAYRHAISNFIDYTEDLKSWIDSEVSIFLGDVGSFSLRDFEQRSPFFQKEIIRYLYEKHNNGTIGLSEGNIEEILRFILTARGGTEKRLGDLTFRKKKNVIAYSFRLS